MNKNKLVCSAVDKALSDIEQQGKESGRQYTNDQQDNYLAKHLYF
ncbi:hypothetical protein [Sphingobacterium siyangense]|jgi:hypothetical protein|nr:hypothetical protein [Sphingobacterium siyangense]